MAGAFAKAADTLDLPNAPVTRLLQGLEQDLKVRLLRRTTRSLTVTPEGATHDERATRLLADLANIESTTSRSQARPSGKVRVGTASAIGSSIQPRHAGLLALLVVHPAANRIGSQAARPRQSMQVHNAHEVDDDRPTPVTSVLDHRQRPAVTAPVSP